MSNRVDHSCGSHDHDYGQGNNVHDGHKSSQQGSQKSQSTSSGHDKNPPQLDGNSAPKKAAATDNNTSQASTADWLKAINDAREKNNLPPLKASASLSAASKANNDANKTNGLGHYTHGMNGSMGQITAEDSSGETPEKAVQQWLNSPPHRAILLSKNYTTVGFDMSGNYATADFS